MWRSVLVLGAACGRVGFEPVGGDRIADAGADAVSISELGFDDLCTVRGVTIVSDGMVDDDATAAMMASAVTARCTGLAPPRTVSQDDPGILDPASGRPLLPGDELAVFAGGDGPQRAIAYLHRADTPLVWTETGSLTIRERATGRTVVTGSTSMTHDFALVMVVQEPIGGSRTLLGFGSKPNGTLAAGYWFANRLDFTSVAWQVIEWTDGDGDRMPGAGDAFALRAQGP